MMKYAIAMNARPSGIATCLNNGTYSAIAAGEGSSTTPSASGDTIPTKGNVEETTTTGKIVTQWPFSALDYGALLRTLGRPSEITRRRGAPTDDATIDDAVEQARLDVEAEEPLQYQRW